MTGRGKILVWGNLVCRNQGVNSGIRGVNLGIINTEKVFKARRMDQITKGVVRNGRYRKGLNRVLGM